MPSNPKVQVLSLQIPGCLVAGIVAHEFIHALGFWHEQSRPDRDEFITVNYQNIPDDKKHNFNKYTTNQVDLLHIKYDYGSVMHYGPTSFSSNGQATIVPKESGVTIGQRKGLSAIDAQELREYYGCA
jgi:hypothetical protein